MAQHSKWVGRLTVVVFGALLAGVIVCSYNVSASASGTGIFNDQGVEIVLESQVNDSILWHVPLPDVEHYLIFASMVHDELGNSYVLTKNSIVSIDLEGRQRWTAIIPKQGKVPRGLIQGEDGTIYLLESAEFLDNRYTENTGWITAVSPFTGKILWENGLPNGERMSPNIVAAGNKNGVFVVSAETGAHIAYDRNGNILWVNSMNEAWSLAVDPTGGFVAAGYNGTYGTNPYIVLGRRMGSWIGGVIQTRFRLMACLLGWARMGKFTEKNRVQSSDGTRNEKVLSLWTTLITSCWGNSRYLTIRTEVATVTMAGDCSKRPALAQACRDSTRIPSIHITSTWMRTGTEIWRSPMKEAVGIGSIPKATD